MSDQAFISEDHFVSLLRLAAEKGRLDDAHRAIEDADTLALAQTAAKRNLGQYRMVLDVVGDRWLARIAPMLPADLRSKALAGNLHIKPSVPDDG